jgi:hypothetical protein
MKRSRILPWLTGLALALGPHDAGASTGRVPPSPSDFQAVRLDGSSIHLDGVPDEPLWQQATFITGLTSFDPIEGGPPVGQMSAWIFYDEGALYVAARIALPPGALRGRLAARERWNNDDLFEIMLDPFLDRRTGYDFTVNPFGVQLDYAIVDDDFNSAWDGVWDSAVARDASGFSVEIRIPFRTLRFSSAPTQDWGIGLGFFSGMKKQYDKWPAMSNDRGTVFTQLAVMHGITGIRPSHDLDVIPTLMVGYGGADRGGHFAWDKAVLLRARDPALVDVGLDVRYGLTSATTLNLTLNPDFSQVEADADQLVYNLRFPVLLDEKRPFFLEGVSTFATPVPLLYTRSIVDPIGGLKLSGHAGRWSFGLLSAYDQLPVNSLLTEATRRSGFEDTTRKDAADTVGRASYDLGAASHVGVFVADKALLTRGAGALAARNDVVAADALLTFSSIYTVIAQVAGSYTERARDDASAAPADAFSGLSYSLTARRHDQHMLLELRSDYYGSGFRAETSSLPRVNILPTTASASYRFTTGSDTVSFVEPGIDLSTIHEASTSSLLDYTIKPRVATRLGANTDLSLYYSRGQETYLQKFRGIDVVGTKITTFPWNALSASLDFHAGDQINYDPATPFLGKVVQGTLDVLVKPLSWAELELRYTKSRLWRPDGALQADVDLYYAKLSASFTTRLSLRTISQLDTYQHQLSNSALLAYQIHPGTEGFLGYQELDMVGDNARPLDRRVFLKLSYRWQL